MSPDSVDDGGWSDLKGLFWKARWRTDGSPHVVLLGLAGMNW